MARIITARDTPILRPLGAPVDPYWPVVGVIKPLHLWPFSVTGDYTDQGSTGGLNLTAAGSGNSFGVSGLVLNGSGWAIAGSVHPDLNNVGATYSLIAEFLVVGTVGERAIVVCTDNVTRYPYYGYKLVTTNGGLGSYIKHYPGTGGSSSYNPANYLNPAGVMYQVIVTYAGGVMTIYKNGVSVGSAGTKLDPANDAVEVLSVGNFVVGTTTPFAGTIKLVGIHKGTAWTPTEVAAIAAGFGY